MNRTFFLTLSLVAVFSLGCKDPGNANQMRFIEKPSDFTKFQMPDGNISCEVVISPGGRDSDFPTLKQIKAVNEETIRSELSKLDWETGDGYDAPQFILAVNGGYPQILASGSTNSESDFPLICECSYEDESGTHRFPSPQITDSSMLPEMFLSFFNNDDRWKEMVKWTD